MFCHHAWAVGSYFAGISVPGYERLSGKCFNGCVQEKKLFTIHSRTHSLKHMLAAYDGTDFLVVARQLPKLLELTTKSTGGFFHSELSPCRTLRVAVNELGSCSGHLLLAWFLGPELFSEVAARGITLTGSHRASVDAVAEEKADFAAIGQSDQSRVASIIHRVIYVSSRLCNPRANSS